MRCPRCQGEGCVIKKGHFPRKTGEATRKETYLMDYDVHSKLRIELYYNDGDSEAGVQGIDAAVVYDAGATDPNYLAEAARQHLRAKFLAAEVGITGVNFAIAETGGFVVCTNEGNADLGVSLPKVHIACMGIEKIIPRAADLGVASS